MKQFYIIPIGINNFSKFFGFIFAALMFVTFFNISAQTSLAPGDLVFTGYTSSFGLDGDDNFSFVLLKAIDQNTVINFTNEGLTSAGTFQCTEEVLTYTCDIPGGLPAGREITITGLSAVQSAGLGYGGSTSAGTVVFEGHGSSTLGVNLATSGDQIIAYQGIITCPSGAFSGTFISMIHMNVYSVSTNADCGNTTAAVLDPDCAAGNGNFSKLPPGLTIGVNAFWEGVLDDYSTEHDDGKFNGCGMDLSTPAAVRTAVLNRNNWIWGDFSTSTITLPTGCTFLGVAPLPVELTAFNVNIINNKAELNWQTATEVNNYGFEIERKNYELGIKNSEFEKIGFVEGHGNSNSPKYYSFTDNSLEKSGKYFYRLKQVDIDGTFEYSDEIESTFGIPLNFELSQNYPNPFNPSTSISYSLPSDGYVTLSIYDILGNEVEVLVNGNKPAGVYSQNFVASKLTSGIYFYTLRTGKFVSTKKMLLMK